MNSPLSTWIVAGAILPAGWQILIAQNFN